MEDEVPLFEAEMRAFEARKEELLRSCEGKFAVFRGDEFLGVFDTASGAYTAGITKWGEVPFLIKEVTREERIERVSSVYWD